MRITGGVGYGSYSFLASALDGGECTASSPGRSPPPPVPIGYEAGCASELVWTKRLEEKSPASGGDRTPIARSSLQSDTILTELPQPTHSLFSLKKTVLFGCRYNP
jgi:hypothetical protein